jgi:hypothetical protein
MIKHIVCWKIKEGLDKIVVSNEIGSRLLGLKGKIAEIKSLEIGFNAIGAPEGNYDVVLVSTFENMQALLAYQSHPAHVEAAIYIKANTEQRAAIDFEWQTF